MEREGLVAVQAGLVHLQEQVQVILDYFCDRVMHLKLLDDREAKELAQILEE